MEKRTPLQTLIEGFCVEFLRRAARGCCAVVLPAGGERNVLLRAGEMALGNEVEVRSVRRNPRWAAVLWQVAAVLYRPGRGRLTLREVFYRVRGGPAVTQRETDAVVADMACLLRVPRGGLGVAARARGMVAGDVRFAGAGGRVVDGAGVEWAGIPEGFGGAVATGARLVLLVEKETVFARLARAGVARALGCLLVTACGFPDVATRAFLRALQGGLGLPVYGLFDCDAAGLEILSAYCYGTVQGCRTMGGGRLDVRWLGVRPTQMLLLESAADRKSVLAMSEREAALLGSFLARRRVPLSEAARREVGLLLGQRRKCEIEMLGSLGRPFEESVVELFRLGRAVEFLQEM